LARFSKRAKDNADPCLWIGVVFLIAPDISKIVPGSRGRQHVRHAPHFMGAFGFCSELCVGALSIGR
ncbi:MAG: hypothetical protein VYE40_08520, partial [Myxococcota bacterium]|nr:hypothetical protein [Myxococcota bacterium]